MTVKRLPPEKRRYPFSTTITKAEYAILELIAHRRGVSMSAAIGLLIRDENERAHLYLIEPEYLRRRSRLEVDHVIQA